MDNVDCSGSENSLFDCDYDKDDNCGPEEGAGVVCSGPLRKWIFTSITTVQFDE